MLKFTPQQVSDSYFNLSETDKNLYQSDLIEPITEDLLEDLGFSEEQNSHFRELVAYLLARLITVQEFEDAIVKDFDITEEHKEPYLEKVRDELLAEIEELRAELLAEETVEKEDMENNQEELKNQLVPIDLNLAEKELSEAYEAIGEKMTANEDVEKTEEKLSNNGKNFVYETPIKSPIKSEIAPNETSREEILKAIEVPEPETRSNPIPINNKISDRLKGIVFTPKSETTVTIEKPKKSVSAPIPPSPYSGKDPYRESLE